MLQCTGHLAFMGFSYFICIMILITPIKERHTGLNVFCFSFNVLTFVDMCGGREGHRKKEEETVDVLGVKLHCLKIA